ncbi:MAG TPA: hypothetical protein VHU19_11835 [Pyrinomonadaceae bacterium]|jgi:hypothetical protein|nr:hypothetical protein [Pyrinomonadaceae bacterium]
MSTLIKECTAPAADLRREDLAPILDSHAGNRTFERALGHALRDEDLLRLLGQYIHFNSVFGSGVANLAGEIGARQDLFLDPEEALSAAADRSTEVAAHIFYAAVDEFGSGPHRRSTHRAMAQATLKAAGRYFGYDARALDRLALPNDATLDAERRVRDGYCLNQAVDERELFHAVGFHMGSEVLADEEFNILDKFLRAERAEFVEHLKGARVEINGGWNVAYRWIQVHTSVEADHFSAAVVGANLALRYYAGAHGVGRAKEWLVEGFREFASVQTDFMSGLLGS